MAKNEYQKRVWALYRISDGLKDSSLVQRKICRQFVTEKDNWSLKKEIEQDVTKYSCPLDSALKFIFEAARKNEFDIILCFAFRFLCRRKYELASFVHSLADYDVVLWSVNEGRYEIFLPNNINRF